MGLNFNRIFLITVDMNGYIIKVMSMMDSDESDSTPIIIKKYQHL